MRFRYFEAWYIRTAGTLRPAYARPWPSSDSTRYHFSELDSPTSPAQRKRSNFSE